MTTHAAAYGRVLLLGSALLLAGAVLFRGAGTDPVPASVQAGARPTSVPESTTTPVRPADAPSYAPRPATSAPSVPNDQPVSGDGPAGDHAVQRLLDRATPTDLPPATARHLTRLATRVWLAETTGAARADWPRYFTASVLRAPYRHVRVQAAIVRQAGRRAEVRLVWAGADAAGEFRDGRTGHVLLELHRDEWVPVR
ncbi:hypothetical protein [Streptomyces sp. NPDC058486]|uniref:hypothetical protein n=1 Tax=unclassified Streptomyces TaxID=2593676 RepID=UPI00365705E1